MRAARAQDGHAFQIIQAEGRGFHTRTRDVARHLGERPRNGLCRKRLGAHRPRRLMAPALR